MFPHISPYRPRKPRLGPLSLFRPGSYHPTVLQAELQATGSIWILSEHGARVGIICPGIGYTSPMGHVDRSTADEVYRLGRLVCEAHGSPVLVRD